MSIFEGLKASLEEAAEIQNEKRPVSRVTRYEVTELKAIRSHLCVSQQEFAIALGTSLHTIKSWEYKRRNPTGMTAKVLATIRDNPDFYNQLASH